MKLEDLVPPLELCKQIPEGYFEESVFAWWGDVGFRNFTPYLRREECNNTARDVIAYPAPTYEEIVADIIKRRGGMLTTHSFVFVGKGRNVMFCVNRGIGENMEPSAATAALKMWLNLHASEAEK